MKQGTQFLFYTGAIFLVAWLYSKGVFAFLNPLWDILLGWTLLLQPLYAILLMSLLVSLITVLVYKYTTDQNLMKQLKDEMKAFQKQAKELKEHPEQAMAVQKKAMETNMKYTMHSFSSTLYTIVPIILIFGWLSAHYAFLPITPGQEFSVELGINSGTTGNVTATAPEGVQLTGESMRTITDGSAIFTFNGDEGPHTLTFDAGGKEYTTKVLVTRGRGYENPLSLQSDGPVRSILVGNKKLIVMDLFGWQLGWLGSYIIFSIVFSLALRKALKVY